MHEKGRQWLLGIRSRYTFLLFFLLSATKTLDVMNGTSIGGLGNKEKDGLCYRNVHVRRGLIRSVRPQAKMWKEVDSLHRSLREVTVCHTGPARSRRQEWEECSGQNLCWGFCRKTRQDGVSSLGLASVNNSVYCGLLDCLYCLSTGMLR